MRAQTTLPVIGVALLLVTSVSVLVVLVGQGAIHDAEQPSVDRSTAIALSERLVENRSPLTVRPNVLNASALDSFDSKYLRKQFGVGGEVAVAVAIDGSSMVDTGVAGESVSFERIVLLQETQERRRSPPVHAGAAVTLPRRVETVELRLQPPAGTTIRAVTADGQVVLQDAEGLEGWYEVGLSRYETSEIGLDAVGPVSQGDLTLVYEVPERRPARLVVSVDA